jgi:olfactory receptor
LRMCSAKGKWKVFSTCGSLLTGVSISHGTVLFMYVRPSSNYALEHDMIVSIFTPLRFLCWILLSTVCGTEM